jgi:putative flippase GtrA
VKRKLIFLAVGAFNTIADYAIFMVLTALLPLTVEVAGVVSGTIMMFVSFFLHKNFTWKDRSADAGRKEMVEFLVGTAATMWLVRPLLMWLFGFLAPFYAWIASWLTIFSEDFIARTGVFGLATVVTLVLNYLWYHLVVFRGKSEKPDSDRGD